MSKLAKISHSFRIDDGKGFKLKQIDPWSTDGIESHEAAKEALLKGVERLSELQEKLYAQDEWSLLVIFQAMDAAGKDGAISHVMSGVNPQGCQVYSFKAPTTEDLDHDYLWRCAKNLPERGRIGIFNRSYYEETLVVRVHEQILENERIPKPLLKKHVWKQRFEDIRNFEQHLGRNGTLVLKFFLHISKEEQKKRFLARLDVPEKNWKFSSGDVKERQFWDDYMNAYEETVQETATPGAPWYVVPADNKWFTRLVVASAIINTLDDLDLSLPKPGLERQLELARAREMLMKE